MQVRIREPSGPGRLARTGVELSREARVRLHWMDFYRRCRNVGRRARRRAGRLPQAAVLLQAGENATHHGSGNPTHLLDEYNLTPKRTRGMMFRVYFVLAHQVSRKTASPVYPSGRSRLLCR